MSQECNRRHCTERDRCRLLVVEPVRSRRNGSVVTHRDVFGIGAADRHAEYVLSRAKRCDTAANGLDPPGEFHAGNQVARTQDPEHEPERNPKHARTLKPTQPHVRRRHRRCMHADQYLVELRRGLSNVLNGKHLGSPVSASCDGFHGVLRCWNACCHQQHIHTNFRYKLPMCGWLIYKNAWIGGL